ncbi:hypothetical protein ACT2CV_08060 [Pasteurellaceae bacterium 22721_9_1]
MTKDEFFEKNSLAGSLAILALDENDDSANFCYNGLLLYRELTLEECFEKMFDGDPGIIDDMTEDFYLDWIISELQGTIARAKRAKQFVKELKKSIKAK